MRSTTPWPALGGHSPGLDARTKVMGDDPVLDAVGIRRGDLVGLVNDDDARHQGGEAEHQGGRREDGLARR